MFLSNQLIDKFCQEDSNFAEHVLPNCTDDNVKKIADLLAIKTIIKKSDLSFSPSIPDNALPHIARISSLETLYLNFTIISNLDSLLNLKLKSLSVGSILVSDDALIRYLAGNKHLRSLRLDLLKLNTETYKVISACGNLTTLHLNSCIWLSKEMLSDIAKSPSLTELSLQYCRLNDEKILPITANGLLRSLYLEGNDFSEEMLKKISRMSNVSILKLPKPIIQAKVKSPASLIAPTLLSDHNTQKLTAKPCLPMVQFHTTSYGTFNDVQSHRQVNKGAYFNEETSIFLNNK